MPGRIVHFELVAADADRASGTAVDKQAVPSTGWFAACTDTEGNGFHLWQGDENAA